jgi:tetratricopeptide (TPR) repeat protein
MPMTSVFLSYVREDAEKARSLAAILERAGHSVWWDRQIKGGAQYSAEIEAALDAAEKVIVLWSATSVRSAWVRDEAAAGRDTGRLVPVALDKTQPPLGFRQFQTIDLSNWNGKGSAPGVKDLQAALVTAGAPEYPGPRTASTRSGFQPSRPLLFVAGSALAIVAAAAILWQLWPSGASGTPTFAIVAADDSGPSRQLAADVTTRVSGLSDPSASEFRVVDADQTSRRAGYVLKIAAGSVGGGGPALTLVSGRDRAILWSSTLAQSQGNSSDRSQSIAITAQRVLSCAADALSYRRETIGQDTLKLYLTGCTQFDAAYGTNSSNSALIGLFEHVIAAAPHFAAAWGKLFALESEDDFTDDDRDSTNKAAKSRLERARQLGIDVPEAYAVKAVLLSPADFIGLFRTLDEGIAKHPDSAFLFRFRGERQTFVGRMNDAVSDASRAVELDPLSPANQQELVSELGYSGNLSTAYAQLRKAERLWPDSSTIGMARYRLDLRYGDPREAQQLYLKYAVQLGQDPAAQTFIQARISPTPENIDAALEALRKVNRQFPPFISDLFQGLSHFGRKDEALDLLLNYPGGKYRDWIGYNAEVLFRPAMRDVWRDPRSMAGAAHVGLLAYWKKSGRWPDFCFDPTLPYDCKKEAAKYAA